jgi:hypothetical protein
MKKLASLLTLCAIGLFAAGCNKADNEPAPTPDTAPSMEGTGSGGPTADHPEGGTTEEAPPTTNEAPPTTAETPPTTPPAGDNSESKPADENTSGDDAATENKPAEAETAPAEGGDNPQ